AAVLMSPKRLVVLQRSELGLRLIYNLLSLAAGLGAADQLNETLLSLLARSDLLNDEYDGLSLRHALRRALTFNQIDNSLWHVWEALALQQPTELPGTPYDGIEGVRQMPASAATRGEPALVEICQALKHFAEFLGDRQGR